MTKVNRLVFFDLEATGQKSSGRPRISEISLVVVNSQDILDLNLKIQDHLYNKNNEDN